MHNNTLWIRKGKWLVLLTVIVVLAGIGATAFIVHDIDAREQASFLDEAKIASASVTSDELRLLSGTAADLKNPTYQDIKARLTKIREADTSIRFAYILADHHDGKLFFYGDSEPASSLDYSAPGDVYEQTTAAEINGLKTGIPFIEGPSSDQWGTWVSSFAPIIDPATGKVVAIVGLDIGVSEWYTIVWKYGFLPVLITMLFVALLLVYAFFARRLQRFATELEMSRDQILLEEQKLKTVCDNLPVGVLVLRADNGAIEIINPSAIKIFGRALLPSQGTPDKDVAAYEIVHENGTPYHFDELPTATALKTGKPFMKQDIFVRHPDGTMINTRGIAAPVKDKNGITRYVVSVIEDITLEREVDKMKTEFVSLASHQLRTPLTGVSWALERLFDSKTGALTKKQKEYLTEVKENNERLLKLVENLLNVAHIETGDRFEIKKTPVDITHMIDSLAIDLVALSKEHHVEIVKDTGFPKKLILSVDDEKMRQVLQNLLSNAVKYSHPDGFVSVGYRAEAGKGIISIKDTGLGIPESEQHHAFEKFFRGTNVQGKATDGTGLGLYIAREILRKMGGDLRFESQENVGTTFYASIPIV